MRKSVITWQWIKMFFIYNTGRMKNKNMPYVNYNGIVANAWIKEDKFAGKVNTMKEKKKEYVRSENELFYANSNGCFSTEKSIPIFRL